MGGGRKGGRAGGDGEEDSAFDGEGSPDVDAPVVLRVHLVDKIADFW